MAEPAGYFSPDDLARLALHEAQTMLELGRHAEARRAAQLAVAQSPDDPRGWALLAWAHSALGDKRTALDCANQAVALEPAHAPWHLLASSCLSALGLRAPAVAAARAAVRLTPVEAAAHQRLALALTAQQRSVQVFGHRIALAGREAAQHAATAVSLAPDSAGSHYTAARVAAHQQHTQLAREHYRHALALAPEHAEARRGLAMLDRGRGRFRSSRAGLVGALQVDPRLNSARRDLGRVLYAQLLVIHVVGALTYLAFAVASAAATSAGGYRVNPAGRAVAAAALTAMAAVWLAHTWQRAEPAVRLFLRRQLATPGWLFLGALLDLFVFACFWAAAIGQGQPVGHITLAGMVAMPIITLALHASRAQTK